MNDQQLPELPKEIIYRIFANRFDLMFPIDDSASGIVQTMLKVRNQYLVNLATTITARLVKKGGYPLLLHWKDCHKHKYDVEIQKIMGTNKKADYELGFCAWNGTGEGAKYYDVVFIKKIVIQFRLTNVWKSKKARCNPYADILLQKCDEAMVASSGEHKGHLYEVFHAHEISLVIDT